jgi:hypothetical protein
LESVAHILLVVKIIDVIDVIGFRLIASRPSCGGWLLDCRLASRPVAAGIEYVGTRYNELADLLNDWGYEVVPDPDESRWHEIVRASPLTGLVKLRGERGTGGSRLSFTVTEFWEEGDLGADAALVRQGASLVTYHYHGQCERGGMRWCLHPAGHPDMPYHHHPFGDPPGTPAHAQQISADAALTEFETRVYLEEFGVDDDGSE